MSNLSDTKLVSGRTPVVGYSYRKTVNSGDLNNLLPPAAYEGSWVYYDNEMQFSTGTEWKTTAPPTIRTPTAAAPDPNDLVSKRQLTLTGYSTTVAGLRLVAVRFQISLDKDLVNPLTISVEAAVTNTGNFIPGKYYTILSLGNTDWASVGVTGTAAVGSIFKATAAGNSTKTGTATFNPNSYTLKSKETDIALVPGTVYYWRGKYVAEQAQESAWSSISTGTFPNFIETPKIITTAGIRTAKVAVTKYQTAFSLPSDNFNYTTTTFSAYYLVGGALAATYSDNNDSIGQVIGDFSTTITKGATYYWTAKHTGFINNGSVNSSSTAIQMQKQVFTIATPEVDCLIGVTLTELKVLVYESTSTPKAVLSKVIWEFYETASTEKLVWTQEVAYNSSLTYEDMRVLKLSTLPSELIKDEKVYYWRCRYLTTSGLYSEYSTLEPVPFIKAALITTPQISDTIAVNEELTRFVLKGYVSEYKYTYVQTNYEIYSANNTDAANLLVSKTDYDKTQGFILAGSDPKLKLGTTYYWRAQYIGRAGAIGTVTTPSNWSDLYPYIQPASIDKPIISIYNGEYDATGRLIKPGVTFQGTEFTALEGANEQHISSTWVIYSPASSDTVFDQITDVGYLRAWTEKNLTENSTFSAKVKYNGMYDSSDWSEPITFQTIPVFKDVVTQPDPNPQYLGKALAIKDPFNGGVYAGDFWQYMIETSTDSKNNLVLASTTNLVNTSFTGGSVQAATQYKFTLTDYLDVDYQQDVKPLFYIGQVVSVRLKSDTTKKMEGYIVRAFGNTVKIVFYKYEGMQAGALYTEGFYILAQYRLILGALALTQASLGSYKWFELWDNAKVDPVTGKTAYSLYKSSYNQSRGPTYLGVKQGPEKLPYAVFSIAEGKQATEAMALYPQSFFWSQAAYWALNLSQARYGYSDWYLPSRDELAAIFYYCHYYKLDTAGSDSGSYRPWGYVGSGYSARYTKALFTSNGGYAGGSVKKRRDKSTFGLHSGFGEIMDQSGDFFGLNRNSYPEQKEYNEPGWILQPRLTDSDYYFYIGGVDYGTATTTTVVTTTSTRATNYVLPSTRKAYEQNPYYPAASLTSDPDLWHVRVDTAYNTNTPGAFQIYDPTNGSSYYRWRLIRRELK
jgi:hypothetical protein